MLPPSYLSRKLLKQGSISLPLSFSKPKLALIVNQVSTAVSTQAAHSTEQDHGQAITIGILEIPVCGDQGFLMLYFD